MDRLVARRTLRKYYTGLLHRGVGSVSIFLAIYRFFGSPLCVSSRHRILKIRVDSQYHSKGCSISVLSLLIRNPDLRASTVLTLFTLYRCLEDYRNVVSQAADAQRVVFCKFTTFYSCCLKRGVVKQSGWLHSLCLVKAVVARSRFSYSTIPAIFRYL